MAEKTGLARAVLVIAASDNNRMKNLCFLKLFKNVPGLGGEWFTPWKMSLALKIMEFVLHSMCHQKSKAGQAVKAQAKQAKLRGENLILQ